MVIDSMVVGTVPVHDIRRLPDQVLLDYHRKGNVALSWLSLPPFFLKSRAQLMGWWHLCPCGIDHPQLSQ